MKFKIWDEVRLTREAIAENPRVDFEEYEISWWKIIRITDYWHYVIWNSRSDWSEEDLELIPKEPEFKRWEIVEVWSNAGTRRVKRIFLCEIAWAKYPYICVDDNSQENFLNWKPFLWAEWSKIRKAKWKLTRKEIAEKFWVNEDFELIED